MAKLTLIDDVRRCWRLASVQLHGTMILIAAVYEIMPVLSPEIAAMLPAPTQAKAIGLYAIVGVLARVTKKQSNAAG